MALKGLVKISSVNNLSDARYVAGMGVDFMGFDLDNNSPHEISWEEFAAITSWVSGVKLVGEFESIDAEQLEQIKEKYPIDMVQVSDPTNSHLGNSSLPLIIRITTPEVNRISSILDQFKAQTSYYLLDFDQPLEAIGLTKQVSIWQDHYPIILGGPMTPSGAMDWLDLGVKGIALQGGHEIKPGYKDFDELADILEALEIDDLV